MLVKSKTAAFIGGKLLNVGKSGFTEPFEYKPKEGRKLPGHLVVVKADEPVVKADEPVVKADEPVVKADEPVVKADEPVVKADEPVVKADEPVVKADEPVVKADEPVVKADEPVVKADEPETGKTKKQIMAELDGAGIDYNSRDTKAELVALLDAEIAKTSPGGIKPLDRTTI